MWSMKTAFYRDICGYEEVELMHQVEFRDWASEAAGDGSRSVRRYLELGREGLARLGAWPWCLAENGRPTRHWYRDEQYARPLALWHYQQTVSVVAAALAAVESAAGATPQIASHTALNEARAAYRRIYETTLTTLTDV
jgi:hypothetical protein